MDVDSSWPDHLPTLSAAKTSELSLLVKSPFLVAERPMPAMLLRLPASVLQHAAFVKYIMMMQYTCIALFVVTDEVFRTAPSVYHE